MVPLIGCGSGLVWRASWKLLPILLWSSTLLLPTSMLPSGTEGAEANLVMVQVDTNHRQKVPLTSLVWFGTLVPAIISR